MSEVITVLDLAACLFKALARSDRPDHLELCIGRLKDHLFWSDCKSIWLIDLAEKKLDAIPINCWLLEGPVRDQLIEWLQKSPVDREISEAGYLNSVVHDYWANNWHNEKYSPHKTSEPYLFGDWIFQHHDEMDQVYLSRACALRLLGESALGVEPEIEDQTDIPW